MKTERISSPGCTNGMLRNVAPDHDQYRPPCPCTTETTFCAWLTDAVWGTRFRADMWARIAEEMAMPWRAVEAMHWQMGEHEMAKRAGVTPFSLANAAGSSYEPSSMGPRPPLRNPPPRLRRESMPHEMHFQGPQLPSLAELTAGLPAFPTPPYQSSDPFHHLYNHHKGRNAPFQ